MAKSRNIGCSLRQEELPKGSDERASGCSSSSHVVTQSEYKTDTLLIVQSEGVLPKTLSAFSVFRTLKTGPLTKS